jgi:hypothetical protein
MRTVATLLLCGVVIGLACGASLADDVAVDPAVQGHWESAVPGPQGTTNWTQDIAADGKYTLTSDGPGKVPQETGTIHAAKGKFDLESSAGRHDQGVYSVMAARMMMMLSPQGNFIWKRVEGKAAGAKTGDANVAQKPVNVPNYDPRAVVVLDLLDAVKTEAKNWQPDAILDSISVSPSADGTVDLTSAASPLVYTFVSPGQQAMDMIQPDAAHTLQSMSLQGRIPPVAALPDKMASIGDVLAQARKDGLQPQKIHLLISATPSVGAKYGLPNHASYTFQNYGISQQFLYDASTGRATTPEALSGDADVQQLLEHFKRLRPLPPGATPDFATFRAEGDKLAHEWNPGLYLFRVDCCGTQVDDAVQYDNITFDYMDESGLNWLTVTASANGLVGAPLETRQRAAFKSPAAPDKVLTEQEAMKKLWALNPNMGSDANLQLVCAGIDPTSAFPMGPHTQERLPMMRNFFDPKELSGRWVWRMIAARANPGTNGKGEWSENHAEFLYMDATTGEVLSAAGGPLNTGHHIADKRDRP